MTDRYCGFTVYLDRDIREDDAEVVISAIRMIKHVISVEPIDANPTLGADVLRDRMRVYEAMRQVIFPLVEDR